MQGACSAHTRIQDRLQATQQTWCHQESLRGGLCNPHPDPLAQLLGVLHTHDRHAGSSAAVPHLLQPLLVALLCACQAVFRPQQDSSLSTQHSSGQSERVMIVQALCVLTTAAPSQCLTGNPRMQLHAKPNAAPPPYSWGQG